MAVETLHQRSIEDVCDVTTNDFSSPRRVSRARMCRAYDTMDPNTTEEDAMVDMTLDQAQRLVDQLNPRDQARLLAYLASQLAQVVPATTPAKAGVAETTDAWEQFFQLGGALAATDTSEGTTLTAAVLDMRR